MLGRVNMWQMCIIVTRMNGSDMMMNMGLGKHMLKRRHSLSEKLVISFFTFTSTSLQREKKNIDVSFNNDNVCC